MSDHMMSAERADGLLNKNWASTNIQHDYAAALHTVIAQAEQIERLQAALREADENTWEAWATSDPTHGPYTTPSPEGIVATYEALHPGDMGSDHGK